MLETEGMFFNELKTKKLDACRKKYNYTNVMHMKLSQNRLRIVVTMIHMLCYITEREKKTDY